MNDRRYFEDPVFRSLVDTIHRGMKDGVFTPTDVRDALLVASIQIESVRTQQRFLPAEPG